MNWRGILPFSVIVAVAALLAIQINYQAYLLIIGLLLVAWLAAPTLGWVVFVEACRCYERRHVSVSRVSGPRGAGAGNSSNRAERPEPARYQSGSAHPALRPGAARGAAHASARPEPDPTTHRP